MANKRVVITGMGIVSCFGDDVNSFYEALLQGKSGVRPIEKFPCEDYPTRFAGSVKDFDAGNYLDKKQARRVDPFIAYTAVAGKKALEMAGYKLDNLDNIDKKRAGILIGSGMGGMDVFSSGVETIINKGYKRLTPFFVPYIITNMGSALLAIDLGFMGPNYSISTACATGNYCIVNAANHIRQGHADVMLCGGAEAAISPVGLSGFVAIKALSENNDAPEEASRPWDKNRNGFVMGEGAGVLMLESLEHAQKRGATIIAEYLGGALNCDASHMTDPREDGSGVALCIETALADANISKERVNYINAHATSTIVGDMAEIRALKKVFGKPSRKIYLNATKSMTGHPLGAAAGIEAVTTAMAIKTGKLHATKNLEDKEDGMEDFEVWSKGSKDCDVDVALSNSFGFGGHNSCILLAKFKA
ncbi:MAG: beta-ketoacyl-ACP synthase II [Parachlamydiales bacterium]|nr:beta-ketoacyl-ACP synthase II [Parachlamydiales bacterium]